MIRPAALALVAGLLLAAAPAPPDDDFHYHIASIPTLLVFQNGRIAARYTGVTPEATLRAQLQELRR